MSFLAGAFLAFTYFAAREYLETDNRTALVGAFLSVIVVGAIFAGVGE